MQIHTSWKSRDWLNLSRSFGKEGEYETRDLTLKIPLSKEGYAALMEVFVSFVPDYVGLR